MVVPAEVNTNALTGLVIRIIAKLLVAAIVVFVLTRVISPMLMDVRSNLAFWGGVACWPLALVAIVLAAAWIRDDFRTLRRLRSAPIRLSGPD
jgi:hypothetical protein